MSNSDEAWLTPVSDVRQAVEGSPSILARYLALATLMMVAALLIWLATSRVSVVIEAAGIVRSDAISDKVFTPVTPRLNGEVAEVRYEIGDIVEPGQPLIVLDTSAIDIEITEVQSELDAAEQGLAALDRLSAQIRRELDSARTKAELELASENAKHALPR